MLVITIGERVTCTIMRQTVDINVETELKNSTALFTGKPSPEAAAPLCEEDWWQRFPICF